MKQQPEDLRPTAYLLGEMDADEAAAFELAAAGDSELQATLRDHAALHQNLTSSLIVGTGRLSPSQRQAILKIAREADQSIHPVPTNVRRIRKRPWMPYLATAAAVIFAFLAISRMSKPAPVQVLESRLKSEPELIARDLAEPEPQAIVEPNSDRISPDSDALALVDDESRIPALPTRDSLTVAECPSLQLPVDPGKPSLPVIMQLIREERRLPTPETVRLEGILSSFSIRLRGVTAVARVAKSSWHPDTREAGMSTHAATLASEIIACPWKPSAKLLLISVRGNPVDDCEASLVFRPDANHVLRYRLLGYAPSQGGESGSMPTRLAAGSAQTLIIEIEPSTTDADLGRVDWTVNGQPAAGISVAHDADVEPSDDARFAALVCTYAQWLAGEQAGIIDASLLAALAREIDAETLPVERRDFLKLINQSLNL